MKIKLFYARFQNLELTNWGRLNVELVLFSTKHTLHTTNNNG